MSKHRKADTTQLATVHRLPIEQDAIDGELLTDEEYARLTGQREQAFVRWHGYRSDLATVARTTRTVATHEKTKAVVRELVFVPIGAGVLAKRLWEAKTNSRYERLMRAAELAGNMEALLEWEQRAEQAKQRRHSRRMDLVELPFRYLKALGAGLGIAVGGLVGLGIVMAAATKHIADVIKPLMAVVHLINTLIWVVGIAWGPLVLAAPWLGMLGLWHVGRKHSSAPSWLATSAEVDDDLVIDETTIARALESLRIPQITAYLKQGMPLQYITPARRDGRGTHAQIRLPAGVTAEEIARRRGKLAGGLHRAATEVWPTTGTEAGLLDLWIADKGALAEGAGPYPLLTDGTVDVFKGVPLGRTLRGDEIKAPLMERNTIAGGMPGQGKSSAARAILAGAALDPTAEIWIHVPDSNFDFELFKRRAARYVMGAEDERIEEILRDLEDLHEEVQRRGELLIKYEEPAVTRKLASAGVGLHPLFYLLEEAHIAIQHRTYGKDISRLLVDIVKLGRKRGIHVIVSTQAPTKDSMPRDVTRNCSNGIAFAVGDHVPNDALLGQGAYRAGHRATELIPGTDRGTAVCKGLSGERSDIVQVYFISIEKDHDQLTPIIDRAMDAIERRGKGLPGKGARRELAPPRDLLEDLAEVLGDETVPAADVPALLREYAPAWAPYRSLTGKALRERLADEYGVKVPSTGNRWPVDPDAIREALAERS
jgi:DNA segregation ATPase FtsK/SpoIIIE, S-DNA-T family